MTPSNIDIPLNIADETAIVTGIYTLQRIPKANGQVEQTSGKLTLVLANIDYLVLNGIGGLTRLSNALR